jgi:uncharacterized membrane protein YfcA
MSDRRRGRPRRGRPISGTPRVGVVVGLGGLVGHLPAGIDWDLLAAGCAGGVPGAFLGAKLTGRLDEHLLLRAMAAVLVISGLAMLVQAALGG